MIGRSELLPPSESFASTVGAGVSEDSDPVQFTTLPSEYVWLTWKVNVFAEVGVARNWKTESSPVGTLPPLQVTFWITASSPDPVCCTCRAQPGAGAKESIAKPEGGVNSIVVVFEFASSVGTASVKSWSSFASATGGLTSACAKAPAARIS